MPRTELYCSYCGKRLSADEGHCYKCGHTTADAVPEPPEVTRVRDGAPSAARLRQRKFRRKPLRPEDIGAVEEWPEDAPEPGGRFCRYCGKRLHTDEYHCYKCGHSTHDSLEHRPSELIIKSSGVSAEDLRDRRTPASYFILGGLLMLAILVPAIYYGVWVLPNLKQPEVHPEIADLPMEPVEDPMAVINPPEEAAPSGPVASADDAIARVSEVWVVKQWLADMRSAGANVQLGLAEQDAETYLVQVFEVKGEGAQAHTLTMGWYVVEKATGEVRAREAPAAEQDRALTARLEALARGATDLRPDVVEVTIAGDWAFADVAEQGADGAWSRFTAVLLRNSGGGWKPVTTGDPSQWEVYRNQMPPATRSALDAWLISHLVPQ